MSSTTTQQQSDPPKEGAPKKSDPPREELSFKQVMDKAAASAVRGGTAGACAMGANVACLMWMRTTVCQ
jgi:hypothetical protein